VSVKENEERDSQLAAMFDGELPQIECELVARRLSRDENLRRSWENYALISAVMRSEQMAGQRLAPRVAAAISNRPSVGSASSHAQVVQSSAWSSWAIPLGGAGLAASIAVIVVLGVSRIGWNSSDTSPTSLTAATASQAQEVVIPAAPYDRTTVVAPALPKDSSRTADSARVAAAAAPGGEPESYVTPPLREGSEMTSIPPFELASYVSAHSAVSAPMMRHSAISAVIATPQQGVSGSSMPGTLK